MIDTDLVLTLAKKRGNKRKSITFVDDLAILVGCHPREASEAVDREIDAGHLQYGEAVSFPFLTEEGKRWLKESRV